MCTLKKKIVNKILVTFSVNSSRCRGIWEEVWPIRTRICQTTESDRLKPPVLAFLLVPQLPHSATSRCNYAT